MSIQILNVCKATGERRWVTASEFHCSLVSRYWLRDPDMTKLPLTGTVLKLMLAGF